MIFVANCVVCPSPRMLIGVVQHIQGVIIGGIANIYLAEKLKFGLVGSASQLSYCI